MPFALLSTFYFFSDCAEPTDEGGTLTERDTDGPATGGELDDSDPERTGTRSSD